MAKSKTLTLAIIIPVHDEESHIAACLDTIAAQTVKPNEVIVVDNNSTDNSVIIASSYPFVRVIKEKKQGIAYARNKGFNSVKSDIIGRIDADSRLPANWVERMTGFIAKNPGHLITGGSYFYDLRPYWLFSALQGQLAFRVNRFIMGHYIAWGSNMAFRRELWESVKNEVHNDPDIHEDMDLSVHLVKHGFKITYRANWRVGIDSRLFSPKRKTRKQHLIYLKMWPRTLEKHHYRRAWIGWVGVYAVYFSYWPLLGLHKLMELLRIR